MTPLHALLAQHPAIQTQGLNAQLHWLEDCAAAALHPDLGEAGVIASRQLRAALGAIVAYAETPKERRDAAALGALLQRLIGEALDLLRPAVSDAYATLDRDAPAARPRR